MDYFTKVNKEYETIKKEVLSKNQQTQTEELKKRHEELLKIQREEHFRLARDNELRIKQEQALKLQREQELKKYHQEQLEISDEIFRQLKLQETNKSSMTTNNINNERSENLTFIPNLDVTTSPIRSRSRKVEKSSQPQQHAVNIFVSQDKAQIETADFFSTTSANTFFQETGMFGNFSSSEKSLNALVILSDDETTIEETIDFNKIPKRVSSKGIFYY